MSKNIYVIILSAGKGTRMSSKNENQSKVAFPILGKPLVNYVLDASKCMNAKETFVVVGFGGEATAKCVQDEATIVWQKEVLGTGHAVMQVSDYLKDKEGDVMILCGDTPLLTPDTLQKIYRKHVKSENALTICSTVLANPTGYGRVIREEKTHRVMEVRPYAEINEEESEINEINSGIYVVDNQLLQQYLPLLSRENKKDEYYLSDIVGMIQSDGHLVDTYVLEDAADIYNINDRVQLSFAAKVIRKRVNHALMLSGVSIEDPDTAYISPDVEIGKDTIILPNTTILGKCTIGEESWIGPNATLIDTNVGNKSKIYYSTLTDCDVGGQQSIGPFKSHRGEEIC